ncbi:hypothetical protein KR054_005789 [Drosophila jambulina]|nr:hypothetical protein KR054_005789 [Drosophila jambulina]
MMLQEPEAPQKSLVRPTYLVTIIMLIIGQLQVLAVNEFTPLKDFLAKRYFLSLIQFLVSFLSIQLYGFFYHLIVTKSIWLRILAGLWTYEVNTLSIMKLAKRASYFTLAVSVGFTYLMMLISAIYGCAARRRHRGLFISRHKVILWSERLFVVTCFGIIVCAEMHNIYIEFSTLIAYTLMSNVFVIVFGASLRRPNFYHRKAEGDYILIGQLYYLNFFALYMSIVWTTHAVLDHAGWDIKF